MTEDLFTVRGEAIRQFSETVELVQTSLRWMEMDPSNWSYNHLLELVRKEEEMQQPGN